MSINTVRQVLEKPVFAWGCSIIIGAAIVVGLFQVSCAANSLSGQSSDLQEVPVATVAGEVISFQEVEELASAQPAPNPSAEAAQYADAIGRQVEATKQLAFAKQKGIELDVEAAKEAAKSIFNQNIETMRTRLVAMGELKEGASDQELSDALEKLQGQSLEAFRTSFEQDVDTGLASPARKDLILSEISRNLVLDQYSNRITVTDEQLESSFDTLTVKRIMTDSREEAERAIQDIQGGMSFEDAMDKYSEDFAPEGKKKSESVQDLPRSFFLGVPGLGPVAALSKGEVSGILEIGSNFEIYKILDVKPNKPADFDKNKESLRTEVARTLAFSQFQEEYEQFSESAEIKWADPGYELLYKVQDALVARGTAEETKKQLEELEQKAAAVASTGNPESQRPALLAQFYANNELLNMESTNKEVIARRIDVVKKVLETTEDVRLRLELVDRLSDLGRGEEAAEQLVMAASVNNDLGQEGTTFNQEIAGYLQRLQNEKQISDEQADAVRTELKRWADEKKQMDEYEAEMRRQEEEAIRQAEEAEKKAKEAAGKEKAGSEPKGN